MAPQSRVLCWQALMSKYNQQYHKLFKDIPLEEMVLKGEPLPGHCWWGPRPSTWDPLCLICMWEQFRCSWLFFLQKCEETGWFGMRS